MDKFTKISLTIMGLVLLLGFIDMASSQQLNLNEPKVGVKIIGANVVNFGNPNSSTSSSSGANVTSVSSGDGCIFVSPTTGNVVITFNTSCGSGVTSVTAGIKYIVVSPTTGNVIVSFNETQLNQTISDLGNRVGFNSTFNITYQTFAYNQTSPVFTQLLLNNTIAQYGNLIGFNSSFNITYQTFAYNMTTPVFSQLLLNNTISQYGLLIGFNNSVVLPNSTTLHCSNITGNSLCQTGTPTFGATTINGLLKTDIPAGFGESIRTTLLGGLFNLGHVTTENTVYQFEPFFGFGGMFVGNCSVNCFNMADSGLITIFAQPIGTLFQAGAGTNTFQTNATVNKFFRPIDVNTFNITNVRFANNGTRQLSIVSHNHNGTGNISIKSNFTGEIIPHPSYDITGATAFDTDYNNTLDRPILITFHATALTSILDSANKGAMQGFASGFSKTNQLCLMDALRTTIELGCSGAMVVQPSEVWKIASDVGGSGSITLNEVWVNVL